MKKIAIVDIETTGFQSQGGVIIEIGIVSLNTENGEIEEEFGSFVKEEGFGGRHTRYPLGWIFNNSTIRYEDIVKAPSFESVKVKIQKILNNYKGVTAYNKQFDFGFLRARGLLMKELPCIMLSAAPVVNLPSTTKKAPKWPSLEEAWRHFYPNVSYKEAHRAVDDARDAACIAYELYTRGNFLLRQEVRQEDVPTLFSFL